MAGTADAQRVAVVTGANRGLGLETCRQLASEGFRVVLTARRESSARESAEHLGTEHTQLDVTDAESIERAAAALGERYGQIDVLVNNAGISIGGSSRAQGGPGGVNAKRVHCVNIAAMAIQLGRPTDRFFLIQSGPRHTIVAFREGRHSCLTSLRMTLKTGNSS